jgi:hypothetical protein
MDGYHPEGLEVFRVRLRKQVFGSEQPGFESTCFFAESFVGGQLNHAAGANRIDEREA